MILMAFQVALASTNIYYFSKDLELVLPLPIKSDELLIAKFNILILNLYCHLSVIMGESFRYFAYSLSE